MHLCVTFVSVAHVDLHHQFCTDTDVGHMFGLDEEEISHADFDKGEYVMTLPKFADQLKMVEGAYQQAVTNLQICKENLKTAIESYKNPAVPTGESN